MAENPMDEVPVADDQDDEDPMVGILMNDDAMAGFVEQIHSDRQGFIVFDNQNKSHLILTEFMDDCLLESAVKSGKGLDFVTLSEASGAESLGAQARWHVSTVITYHSQVWCVRAVRLDEGVIRLMDQWFGARFWNQKILGTPTGDFVDRELENPHSGLSAFAENIKNLVKTKGRYFHV